MMYLVLTALLALNVSKEVLDGFVRVDEGLEMSESSLNDHMRSNYAGFERYANNVPGRAMEYWEQARGVRAEAEEITLFIDKLKARAIASAEGLAEEQVIASNGLGRDTVLDLAHVNELDDTDAISYLMIGSEPATPKEGEYTPRQLREKLEGYQLRLKKLVSERSPELSASLEKRFNFSDRPDASGVMNNWESLHFYHVPLAAGVTMLSKLQNDVRQAESDVVKYLYRSVSDETTTATQLAPAVIPVSDYVTVGDIFKAEVFLAAYYNKNPPVIELAIGDATIDTVNMEIIGEKRTIPVGADGKGNLELPADVVGEMNPRGIIKLAGITGVKRFLFDANYTVARPALVAAPTMMNVLYRHFDNPVELSVPGFSADQIRPSIDNGTITRSGNTYIVKSGSGGSANITVVAELPNGGTN